MLNVHILLRIHEQPLIQANAIHVPQVQFADAAAIQICAQETEMTA